MQLSVIEHSKTLLSSLLMVRTNSFKNEVNPATSEIGPLVQRFYTGNIAEKIPH